MQKHQMPITVIGAGSWGTALALTALENHQEVRLWSRDEQQIKQLQETRKCERYLPGVELPESLKLYTDLSLALNQVKHVIVAVPSHAVAEVLQQIHQHTAKVSILSACKGLDIQSGQFQHEVMQTIFGHNHFGILSGPSFAHEVAKKLPTASLIASSHPETAEFFLRAFQCNYFRIYKTEDIVGVQIAGTIKNILAIAAGLSDGLQLGANARAALITRGLVEMVRLGTALGADIKTFYGLAGMGDLILTASGEASRNRRFGLLMGQGEKVDAALAQIKQTVEGIHNTKIICKMARELKIDLPICSKVEEILFAGLSPTIAAAELLSRPNVFEC